MAKKKAQPNLSVEEKLRYLYQLQLVDSELDEIEVLKGELPIEVNDLKDEITGLETRAQRLQDDITEQEKKVNGYQAQIQESNALIERYDRQLTEVKNNREYESLTREIELQRLEIQLSEKRIRETQAIIEQKREMLNNTNERTSGKNEDLERKEVELAKIIEKTEKNEAKLRRKSDRQRKKLTDRLLFAYDRIRNNYRNGLAVVTVERESCGGCFNKIPPQLQLEIGQRKQVIACEHCGRVLVDEMILTEPTPEKEPAKA